MLCRPLIPLPQASTGKKRKRPEDEALKESLIKLLRELEASSKRQVESEEDEDENEDSLSEATKEDLVRLGIKPGGFLRIQPKDELISKLNAANEAGKTEHWSSKGLYEHLRGLENFVPAGDRAAKHLWINAFLSRAAAMSPPDKQTVLTSQENPTSSARDYAAYTVFSVGKDEAESFLRFSQLLTLDRFHQTLLVVAAKTTPGKTPSSPQPSCRRSMLRGALTNGREWVFILLKANPNGDGFGYWLSDLHKVMAAEKSLIAEVSSPRCDIVAGILAHWLAHSDEDISDDDWFICHSFPQPD
ncbi:hypothetical protein AAF712_013585 [Marasmius tenuissimus]|uniref:Uncharacterized protein n=1 Tax=Marasmius tenuissimus TaxID=585030 RepID=A0ABR2ZGT3_9AGAR